VKRDKLFQRLSFETLSFSNLFSENGAVLESLSGRIGNPYFYAGSFSLATFSRAPVHGSIHVCMVSTIQLRL
jgi:hypothetical protein